MKTVIVLWIFVTSLVAFVLYGIDKAKAKRRAWRIPESVLLGIAALGGSMGALLGMQLFRHKTKHLKFLFCVPLFVLLNAFAVWFLFTEVL